MNMQSVIEAANNAISFIQTAATPNLSPATERVDVEVLREALLRREYDLWDEEVKVTSRTKELNVREAELDQREAVLDQRAEEVNQRVVHSNDVTSKLKKELYVLKKQQLLLAKDVKKARERARELDTLETELGAAYAEIDEANVDLAKRVAEVTKREAKIAKHTLREVQREATYAKRIEHRNAKREAEFVERERLATKREKDLDYIELDRSIACVVRWDKLRNTLLQPCNHVIMCDGCAEELSNEARLKEKAMECSICKVVVTSTTKIFLA